MDKHIQFLSWYIFIQKVNKNISILIAWKEVSAFSLLECIFYLILYLYIFEHLKKCNSKKEPIPFYILGGEYHGVPGN